MHRRQFIFGAAAAALPPAPRRLSSMVSSTVGKAPATPPRSMTVGTQHGDSDAILRVLAGFGVNHICSSLPSAKLDQSWSVDGLSRLRDRIESFGIALDMVPLPLSSKGIERVEMPNILLGRSPGRDREIDAICE